MIILLCTRQDAFLAHDRQGTVLESLRRAIKIVARFFPQVTFDSCEWRSALKNWPEVDAMVSIPQSGVPPGLSVVMEVMIHFFLDCIKPEKQLQCDGEAIELAEGKCRGERSKVLLTPGNSLLFGRQEIFAFVRAEQFHAAWEIVEHLDRRCFQGLACRVS